MKKLLVLMVLVVAMVAAPLFAEVAAPTFAGDFTYKIGGNFQDAAADSVGNDLDVTLTSSVGEYTTFSVSVEAAPGDDWETSSIEMTQDFSSMIGEGLTLKMTVGNFNHGVTEYETIGLMDQTDSATANAIKLVFGVADVTLNAFVAPTSLFNDMYKQMAFEAVYSTDMISASAAYVNTGVEKGVVEGGVKLVVADLTFDVMGNYDLDAESTEAYAGLQYVLAPVTAKAGFYTGELATGVNLADVAKVGLGVDVAVNDMITLAAGSTIMVADPAELGADAAVTYKFDTVSYKLGVSYKDSGYAAAYKGSEFASSDIAVSFQMDVDF